jgi:hypothetical protein
MTDSQDLVCTGCQKTLRIPARLWGKKVRCPQCGQVLAVPAAVAAAPAATTRKLSTNAVTAGSKRASVPVKAPPASRPVAEVDDVEFIDDADDPYVDLPAPDEDDLPPRQRPRSKPKKRKKIRKSSSGGAFGAEKGMLGAGVLGGMGLMAAAVVWFVVGLMFGYIFYYPPVMFVIGLIAMIKGFISRD